MLSRLIALFVLPLALAAGSALAANPQVELDTSAGKIRLELYPDAVIATPGGIISDAATFGLLLQHCFTVWLQASPEEHMQRVVAQGDLRPMSGNQEAMEDLKRILAGRAAFYAKADLSCSTSGQDLAASFGQLREALRRATGRPLG